MHGLDGFLFHGRVRGLTSIHSLGRGAIFQFKFSYGFLEQERGQLFPSPFNCTNYLISYLVELLRRGLR